MPCLRAGLAIYLSYAMVLCYSTLLLVCVCVVPCVFGLQLCVICLRAEPSSRQGDRISFEHLVVGSSRHGCDAERNSLPFIFS